MATIDTSLVVTRDNGAVVILPYPQEYTPDIYDVDASTNAGMILPTAIWSGESRYIYH